MGKQDEIRERVMELIETLEVGQAIPSERRLCEALRERVPELELKVNTALLPKDEDDARNAILEVRAGTGGEEAALFAAELFRMYQRYAALRSWRRSIARVPDDS